MQLLDVPFSAEKDQTGYYIKAADGRLIEYNYLEQRTYIYIRAGTGW